MMRSFSPSVRRKTDRLGKVLLASAPACAAAANATTTPSSLIHTTGSTPLSCCFVLVDAVIIVSSDHAANLTYRLVF